MQQTDSAKKASATQHDDVLRLARKRFQAAVDGENESRKLRLADKLFAAGEHWPDNIKKQRDDDKRPCLVIDRLKPQIKQVTNQQRQMRPAVQVIPGKGGSKDTAEVFQGLIRHVETSSDSDDAYDQSGKDQVETGLGWYRFKTEYCDDDSGDQRIIIDRIRNPFSIYPDPAAVRRDRSDGKFLFSTSDFLEDELKARYPQATLTSGDEFMGLGDEAPNWLIGDRIRVAEYWTVETTKTDKILANGQKRKVETRKVKCYIITGLEVLDSYEWAGKYIPFVPVLGEEIDINGKVDLRGMVRGAKDPQRMFNYWKSATTEAMALAPKAPFLVAEGQIDKYIKMWQQANIKNLPYLIYTPKTLGDQLAPPPQRQVAEPPIQAMLAETQGSENDIRAATGFFDTNQRETREMSGIAIRTRMQQGEHGNSDYIDNLARAVRFGGRILIDLIPKIYDVARVVRILGLDNKPKTVIVHSGQDNAPAPQGVDPNTGQPALPEGVAGIYDLSVGEYDVEVNAGRDQGTARQEFVDVMQELFKANPELFQIVGDLFFENMDVPNAQQVAERLKKTLPPGLNDDPGMAAQAQVGQLQQQMQLMQQALQQAQQEIATKKAELDSKERIAQAEIDSKEKIALMNADIAKHKAAIDASLEQTRIQAESARHAASEGREAVAQQLEHAHQARAAQQAAIQAIESQHSEHEHASMMQASKPEKAA
jgi:hypothetical protein